MRDIHDKEHKVLVDKAEDLVGVKVYRLFIRKGYVPYVQVSGDRARRRKSLQQHIMGPTPDGMCIDHIDRDPLNNQRSNLRFVTTTQNSWNMGMVSRNTSGLIGIMKKGSKWTARLKIDGRVVHVGTHALDKTAASYRDKAVELMRGEYAVYNFPDRDRSLDTFPNMDKFIQKYVK